MNEDLNKLWDEAQPLPQPQATLKHQPAEPKEENLSKLWEEATPQPQTPTPPKPPQQEPQSIWERAKRFVKGALDRDTFRAHKARLDEAAPKKEDNTAVSALKSISRGTEEAADFLRHPIDKLFKSDEERMRADVADRLSQIKNTSDSSLYSSSAKALLDAVGAREMTAPEKSRLKTMQQDDMRRLSDLLKKEQEGYIGVDDSGAYLYISPEGKQYPIGDLESAWSSLAANKYESTGALAGALAGAKIPGGPLVKAAGALAGGAIGSGTGRAADYIANAIKSDQPVEADALARQAAESAVADPVMTLLTAGTYHGARALTKPAAKRVKEYLVQRNINGAEAILKQRGYTQEQIDDIVSKTAKYVDTPHEALVQPGLEKRRDALTDVALQDPTLSKEVKNAMKQYPGVADRLSDTIEDRTKHLTQSLEERGMSVPQLREEIYNYEKGIKDDYAGMKDIITRASKKYRFRIKDTNIPAVLEDLEKSVGEEHTKSDIKALLHTINKHKDLDTDLLFNVREKINRILRKPSVQSYDDISALRSVKEGIDNEIFKAIDAAEANIDKPALKQKMKESIAAYARMKELQDSHLYKQITKDEATPKSVSAAMSNAAKSFSGTLGKLSQELDPSVRSALEHKAIRSFVREHTKKVDGVDVIDFARLGKDLSEITDANIGTKEAKETLEALKEMSGLFQNDISLMRTATNANVRELNQGISQNPLARIKTMLANKVVKNFLVYTQKDKALRYHIAKSLQKARTPREFFAEVQKLGKKAPDGFLRNMNSIVAQWEKADAKEAAAKRRLAELEAKKAAGEKVRRTELLKAQTQNFTTPPPEEIKAVEELSSDDKYRNFARTLTRIREGTATENDIRKYLVAKEDLDADALQKTMQKHADIMKESQERARLPPLQQKGHGMSEQELEEYNRLESKYNPLFAGGAAAGGAGYGMQKEKDADSDRTLSGGGTAAGDRVHRGDTGTKALTGTPVSQGGTLVAYTPDGKEITMQNNEVLKDGKLTREELVKLIEHAPQFEKKLETFGDPKTEGRDKVIDRMLSVFEGEDPLTALAIVSQNFYDGDDKAFAKAIQTKKIDSISDDWVKKMLDTPKAETPVTDSYFAQVLEGVLKNEGGYVNDPDDSGGETKYGISKRAYPDVDIKNLTKAQAQQLYKERWDALGMDRLKDRALAAQLFDMGVNAGNARAVIMLQRVLGVTPDGIMGPKTVAAANSAPKSVLEAYKKARADYYRAIARGNKAKYLKGWLRRIERV